MENVKHGIKRYSPRNSVLKSSALNAVSFACGFLMSKGAVMGNLAPFGAAFAAAVPKSGLLSAMLGAAFGYIILSPSDSFRYIAVVATVGAARWLFSELKKLSRSRAFAPVVAAVPLLATGIAMILSGSGALSALTDCVIESIIAAVAAYFMAEAVRLAGEKRGIGSFSRRESVSLVMTGCVLLLSLGGITVENISLGRILAAIAVLVFALCAGVSGGAVSGASAGAIFSLADSEYGFVCGGYAFGGLMAGLFAPLGKLGCALAFTISDLLMSLAFGRVESQTAALIECLIASAVFMFMPKELQNMVSSALNDSDKGMIGEAVRKSVVSRLDFAAKAVRNVKGDVSRVSERLGDMYAPSFDTVCENAAAQVCSGCGLRMYCHERERDATAADFLRLEYPLTEKGKITEDDISGTFLKACCKKGELAESVNANFRELLAAKEARRRVDDLRGVVAGQFAGVSDILSDLSREFSLTKLCDDESAERIKENLSRIGAKAEECVCFAGEGGRLKVELMLAADEEHVSRGELAREVSKACGRVFDLPSITEEGGKLRAAFCEMPVYDVEIGSDQHIAYNGKHCGDCIDYFNDGTGKTYALICDGMGTGGRAAVDGNMAVSVMGRLIRSGLSADSSLQIVNSALMVKSDDESLSTVDLVGVDLYTGEATLKKAGAPTTYIRKGGRVLKRDMPSLPAGILNGIHFGTDTIKLKSGDMIVMVSDGAVNGDDKWLEKLIKSWSEGSVSDLAAAVVEEASRRGRDSHDDDITALAMRITDRNGMAG